jgi:hypothetical protein
MLQEAIQIQVMDKSIRDLYQDRVRYQQYPPFQRDKVWGIRRKQMFINFVLRNLPCGSFYAMKDEDVEGSRLFRVVDGQQRIESALEFREDKFPTMSEKDAQRRMMKRDPVEPERVFSQLSKAAQNQFLDYVYHFMLIEKDHEDDLEEIYAGLNDQEPLTVGEKLWIHNCKARHIALKLLDHPFWREVYKGKMLRKEAFQAAMMLIAIEAFSFPLNLRVYTDDRVPLTKVILGDVDSELSDTFYSTMYKRLTSVTRVLHGANIQGKTDVIPAYEGCILLDDLGFDLMKAQEGCLRDWYNQAKRGTLNERLQRKVSFKHMDYLSAQKDFWETYADVLPTIVGLKGEK